MTTTKRRSLIEFSLFVICFFSAWSVRATYLYSIDGSFETVTQRAVYSSLVKLFLWGLPAVGFAYWIRHSSPCQYLGLSVVPSVRQWIFSVVIIAAFLGAAIGYETILGGKELTVAGFSSFITIGGLLFTFVSPLLEEMMFRGLILKELAGCLPGWGANLLTSFLFAGIHLPFWLSQGGLTEAMLTNAVGVFVFSLLAGWLYLRSASVWPPTLAHIVNNLVASLLIAGNG